MSSPSREDDRRALLKRAYAAIDEQQVRIRDLEARLAAAGEGGAAPRREPLAIVGLSCRFPGADGPDEYWQLLRDGVEAITDVPADRWDVEALYDANPEAPGRMYTRRGGFLHDVAGFDADFFGIAPREAVSMDPQQRLLLETTWEALDRAGQPRDRLAGSNTGVFIGITANEYGQLAQSAGGLAGIDAYHITGNTSNAAAGRIAYTLGFRGPAVAVDTACSSSLVAVHLACASIWQGDCDQAIAGGVHLILSPAGHVALSKARVLSPSGRCRTFDAAADGMARGEGCGVIVIRPLAAALRDGDPIVAVIRGSAVNQDGPSSGLTVPNGPAQEDVIRRALANARVEPRQVGYVEAHGTATPLGDPIEIKALGRVLGEARAASSRLLVGSVKTNVGHLEAAAGIAGLIKVALSLEHGTIPPHLHFETPSPQIPWSDVPIDVVTRARPWPRGRDPRIAGVSAFGFSGTNAHVVLEEAPVPVAPADEPAPGAYVVRVAARTDAALRTLAARYAAHVAAHAEQPLADVCATANTGRGDGIERGAVVARDRAALVAGLSKLARGESGPGVARGRAVERRRVGMVFTGRGAEIASVMARALADTEPAFREALERCADALREVLDVDLRAVLADAAAPLAASPEFARASLLAVACGIDAVWRSWGVAPFGVTGLGVGEYAAAVAAGQLDLETAVRLVAQSPRPFADAAPGLTLAAPQLRTAAGADQLRAAGCDVLLEIGGAATRGELLENAATLYAAGVRIDWTALDRRAGRRRVVLPVYPWQRRRFWIERAGPAPAAVPDPCAGWTYEVAWEEKGREVDRLVRPHLERVRADAGAARYADALDTLERRAVRYAAQALQRMGLDARAEAPSPPDALADALGVMPARRPLFARLLGLREKAKVRDARGDEPLEAALARHPDADAELRVLDRCGSALPEVLRGQVDPLTLLFPSDGAASAAHLYGDSPAARQMNGIVEQVVRGLIDERPGSATRLLEIGAGTGGTTKTILPFVADAGSGSTYTFTDVSTAFLAQARARHSDAAFLATARLDIETPPVEQGFDAEAYDVVVAANVLHATRDLGRSLDHAAQLLAPGGVLVLQEWTGALAAIDLVFGLTDGWWRFEDRERRRHHPLLSADQWQTLLAERGFERIDVFGSSPEDRGALGKQAVIIARTPALRGHWVVVPDRSGVGDRVCAALASRGVSAGVVAAEPRALRAALAGSSEMPLSGVLDLRALDAPSPQGLTADAVERDVERACGDLLQLVQSMARDSRGRARLAIVTRGAVSVDGDPCDGVARSPLWGMGKVVPLEHPELRTRLIDVDGTADLVGVIVDALGRHAEETQVASRDGRTFVPRLRPHRAVPAPGALRFDPQAAYLVTGGFGGLGLLLADWLSTRGAGLVVLLGRRGPSADAAEAIRRIAQRGTAVMARQADVADAGQLATVLDAVRASGTRLAGIFHAAGILDDGILLQLGEERLAAALKPKVQGTWNLHVATRDDRLDHFVLFSAATSMFGSAGQASHAAANAFLDTCAAYRKAAGLPALSVNWGAWSRVGAAAGVETAARVRMKGLSPIEPARGIEILERLMQGETPQVGVFSVEWSAIPASMAALPFLAACRPRIVPSGAAAAVAAPSQAATPALAERLRAAPDHRRRPLVAGHVRDEVRRVLSLGGDAPLDMRQGFFDLGFDSLTSMDLRNRLQMTCGCSLPATLVFDYPTPEALVDRLMTLLAPEPAALDAAAAPGGDVADLLTRKLAELRETLGS